jgi:hypothetical protein
MPSKEDANNNQSTEGKTYHVGAQRSDSTREPEQEGKKHYNDILVASTLFTHNRRTYLKLSPDRRFAARHQFFFPSRGSHIHNIVG